MFHQSRCCCYCACVTYVTPLERALVVLQISLPFEYRVLHKRVRSLVSLDKTSRKFVKGSKFATSIQPFPLRKLFIDAFLLRSLSCNTQCSNGMEICSTSLIPRPHLSRQFCCIAETARLLVWTRAGSWMLLCWVPIPVSDPTHCARHWVGVVLQGGGP